MLRDFQFLARARSMVFEPVGFEFDGLDIATRSSLQEEGKMEGSLAIA